ncbi:hypothetical protein ACFS5M_01925 [Lacinutrix iliipiscaria]|uniref:Uncharacterized protein n=1 Tax=Lacinutrix iliipiscaria TaxID=1230532 RepID=A0ABW5WI38_9FLAO
MRKIYSYKDISVTIEGDEEVIFSVELISDGNIISTAINLPNVPPESDPLLEDEGSVSLGKAKDLQDEPTFIFSDIINLIPQEDEIEIHYKVNNQLIVSHNNPKSEEVRPYVLIFLKFLKP